MKKVVLLISIFGVVFMRCAKEEKVAVISTQFGDMIVEFYEDFAPMHVDSFKILTDEGYFDITTFHRVITGLVLE